jgi:ATP-dependent Clp protease ATP-binding subunit ClpA
MTFSEFQDTAVNAYGPALALDSAFPMRLRHRLEHILDVILALLFVGIMTSILVAVFSSKVSAMPALSFFTDYAGRLYGLFLIAVAFRSVLSFFESFFRSYYFRGLETIIEEGKPHSLPTSFEVASFLSKTRDDDIVGGFFMSEYGAEIALRSGLTLEKVQTFLSARTHSLSPTLMILSEPVSMKSYAKDLATADPEFTQFLLENGITEEIFVATADWVERSHAELKYHKRWWSRDNLGRIPSIGKNWSYGQVQFLEKYAHALTSDQVYRATSAESWENDEIVKKLETILARDREANALLVGEAGVGILEVVARLGHMIEEGTALPQIERKRIYLINGDAIIAGTREKGAFETAFHTAMNESMRVGNIVLVIENFPLFLESAQAIGSNPVELLENYLRSNRIQFIATSDQGDFHRLLEPNTLFMELFDKIQIEELGGETLLRLLENLSLDTERHTGVLITYPALKEIADGADRYLPDGVMPDKAIDLLMEVVPMVAEAGRDTVVKSDVLSLISGKTGVPLGEVTTAEQATLLNLETILHDRVIGQDAAVVAIASAMRRARAGIQNPNRPIGSFLFLGPTGVGKTETAKALAAIFFKSDDAMTRLDMSEFKGPDAVERLIGSFAGGKAGVLASKLRERPYAVLLLDEFEKATSEAHDLFLQILDEGKFKDASGKEVNARNTIIIATSNAASGKIWEYFKEGVDLSTKSHEIIDDIIEEKIFKPELLNRFDGVIIFHPLTATDIEKVARLMLERLGKRLKERGITFVVTDPLVSYLSKIGYDPQFGARPMNRAIQEKIEQLVADRILKGEIKPGAHVELGEVDLK